MASSRIVIVYSPNQYVVRCVYFPSNDREVTDILNRVQSHKTGKLGVLVLNKDKFINGESPQQMLALVTGHQPASDVCNVMSGNVQVGTIQADPLLDFELLKMGQTLSQ